MEHLWCLIDLAVKKKYYLSVMLTYACEHTYIHTEQKSRVLIANLKFYQKA